MNDILPFPPPVLPRFGSILVSGTDAREYLQGQLSFDMTQLTASRMELASCNSSQGRVQALLWMIERSDGIALILPAELVDATVVRLRKYKLRSKVQIESGAGRFTIRGAGPTAGLDLPLAHQERDAVSLINWPLSRTLMITPAAAKDESDAEFALDWQATDIRAGLPQVYNQTHELFVALMLNVDLLGGISFEKGCYTGQEIIARTHFRGAVKRRMFRFRAHCAPPAPAARILAEGAHAGDVVDSVATPDGCELLAVISLSQLQSELMLADVPGSGLERMSLPYEVN